MLVSMDFSKFSHVKMSQHSKKITPALKALNILLRMAIL